MTTIIERPTGVPSPAWFDRQWLPRYPLAADALSDGLFRMPRAAAALRRFLEANPAALSNVLVVDVDHGDGLLRALSHKPGWAPNFVVENPLNGHVHAVWVLAEPITRTEYARRSATAWAAAVAEGLRRACGGDPGYSGLIMKNPGHGTWGTLWVTDRLYTLDQLGAALDAAGHLPPRSWRRARRANPVGLGRNCALFETARHWAYRALRHHFGDPTGLARAIHAHAHTLNAEYAEPLPPNEIRAIANSITRWITTRSRLWNDGPAVYEATFTTIQAARGHKGGRKSGQTRQEWHADLVAEEL